MIVRSVVICSHFYTPTIGRSFTQNLYSHYLVVSPSLFFNEEKLDVALSLCQEKGVFFRRSWLHSSRLVTAGKWCTTFFILSILHHALSAPSSIAMQISGRLRRAQSPTMVNQSTVKGVLYSQVAWSLLVYSTRHGHWPTATVLATEHRGLRRSRPWCVGTQQNLHIRTCRRRNHRSIVDRC